MNKSILIGLLLLLVSNVTSAEGLFENFFRMACSDCAVLEAAKGKARDHDLEDKTAGASTIEGRNKPETSSSFGIGTSPCKVGPATCGIGTSG